MVDYTFCIANVQDKTQIISFMNTHWGERHPLVNNEKFFSFYYETGGQTLNFALAKKGEQIAALAGFIPASSEKNADIWVSIWVADKTMRGSGLELMAALPALTCAGVVACNNIRPKTRPFYEFLGYTTGRVGHFYRLADKPKYSVAQIQNKKILPVCGNAVLQEFKTKQEFLQSGFVPPHGHNPYKDIGYIAKRYFDLPYEKYLLFGVHSGGKAASALLAVRVTAVDGVNVLRIVDYIGSEDILPSIGSAVQKLMQEYNAEYADIYCAGIAAEVLAKAGFVERAENDENIIPNYLAPPLYENIDYYYFTNKPQGFVLFKADGDQDRPRID